jgi:hypothetical protein
MDPSLLSDGELRALREIERLPILGQPLEKSGSTIESAMTFARSHVARTEG